MRYAPLQLDLVAPVRRRRWLGLFVLAGGLALAAEMLLHYQDVQAALQRIEASQELLASTPPPRALPKERLEEEMKAALATMRQLALPWAQLVDSLERAAMREVAVLLVQPDAQQRVLRLTAEAGGEEAMLAYVRRLEGAGALSDVHLVSHQVQLDDPRRPLQFTVQASFRPAP